MQCKYFIVLLAYLATTKQYVHSARRRPEKDQSFEDIYSLPAFVTPAPTAIQTLTDIYGQFDQSTSTRRTVLKTVSTQTGDGVFPGNGPLSHDVLLSLVGGTRHDSDDVVNASNLCYTPVVSKPTDMTGVHEKFSYKLLQLLSPANRQRNMVYSPISIQSLLAYVYMGADEQTAEELFRALEIPKDKSQVAYIFESLLAKFTSPSPLDTTPTDVPQIIMKNKMYYNYNLNVCSNNNFARYFQAVAEAVDFSSPSTAQLINYRISKETGNRIRNLIDASTLDSQTLAILVNAIYFKAKWAKVFSTSNTQTQNFRVNKEQVAPINMMYIEDDYPYEDFPELKAQVIQLAYKDSNVSMLVILPHAVDGLPQLEQRLSSVDLKYLTSKLQLQKVTLRLPKFHIEYDVDMMEPLQELKILQLFSNNAQLPGFFRNNQQVGISKVQHKAYIDVNEAGSEAAAASFSKLIPLAIPPKQIIFTADHPFLFLIHDANVVYFAGHVVSP